MRLSKVATPLTATAKRVPESEPVPASDMKTVDASSRTGLPSESSTVTCTADVNGVPPKEPSTGCCLKASWAGRPLTTKVLESALEVDEVNSSSEAVI